MSMHLGHVIDRLPQEQMTMLRPSLVGVVKGFRDTMDEEQTATRFRGNVQPTTPAELSKIEGGENIEEAITIYTRFELKGADIEEEREADRIERARIPGKRWKVISVADWNGQGFRTYICGTVAI